MHICWRAGFRASCNGAMEVGEASAFQQIIERKIIARSMLVTLLRVDLLKAEDIGVERIKHRPQRGTAALKDIRFAGRPVEMLAIKGGEAEGFAHGVINPANPAIVHGR